MTARRVWERLTALSRRWSWCSALLVGAWVAWSAQPLSVPALLTRTQALQYSYPDVYSELHEQPFAFCDSYAVRREETLNGIRARAKALGDQGPMAALAVARQYDAAIGRQYEEDCATPWRPYQNPANFQKVFTQDYPLYYVVSVLNLTEVRLALLQLVTGWLGVVAIALLSVYFWRSSLAPIAGLIVTSVLVKAALKGAMAVALPGVASLGTVDQRFLFPAVTVLLLIAMLQPVLKPARRTAWWIAVGLALTYGLHSMLYYVVDPPVARMLALLGAAYLGLAGLVFRRWQLVAVAMLAGASQAGLDWLFRGPGLQIYAAVTRTNHLTSDAYTNIMIYMGLLERPSPFGLFYMDEIFGWILEMDPVLVRLAPVMAVHQSYAHFGNVLLGQALTSEPLTVLDAVFRRLLIQIFYRPLWFFWTLKVDWVYTSTLLGIFTLNVVAWVRKPLFLVLTPITLSLLVNQFAVNTVMTLVHTHDRWNVLGVMLMFAVAPLYLFAAVELVVWFARRWRERGWTSNKAARLPRPLEVLAVVLVVAACGGFARFAVTTLKQEREFVQVWMTVHQPPAAGLDMFAIVNALESSSDKARQRSGQTDMWIASILRMNLGRHPEMPPTQARQLNQLRQMYYRKAIALSPDNPHFLFAAYFLEIDQWEGYLLSGLQRFPDSVYAPGAAAALHFYGRDLPASTQEWVSRQYETLTDRFLASAPSRVPGFEVVPAGVETQSGTVKAEPADRRNGPSGLVLTMSPGAVAYVADMPTYGSALARLFSSIDLQNGAVESWIAFRGEGRERRVAAGNLVITKESQIAGGRYHVMEGATLEGETAFGLWLRAGPQGATVELRQFYPVADYPRHYYRSGLMDRVRRGTANLRT